jgi:predicted nucleic acid-binding protein
VNVFLDTNVLMDVLLDRKPFADESGRVWFLAERGKVKGFVSSLTFANIYYIVRKLRGRDAADAMLKMMRDTFEPVAFDGQILHQAMDAGFSDFEDAVQYFSAQRAGAAFLLTRNPGHFPRKGLPVLLPGDFLASHSFE